VALSFYAAIYKDTFLDFASDFARFLVDDLLFFTGPGWTIVEAYDDAVGSRQIPIIDTDMDSFFGTFSWKDDTVGVNDWIVLRSVRGTTEFQVFFKISSTVTMQIMVVPRDDWATDVGTPTATPVTPATAFGSGGSALSLTGFLEKEIYTIVADDGTCSFLFDDLHTSVRWTWFGETVGGPASDTRPFLIWDNPGEVRFENLNVNNGNWTRLSPMHDATIITVGHYASWWSDGPGVFLHAGNYPGLPDSARALPVGVLWRGSSYRHFSGFPKNLFSASWQLGAHGTFADRAYVFRNDTGVGNDRPGICFPWDGTTPYPQTPF
jgi:hypothetical protein